MNLTPKKRKKNFELNTQTGLTTTNTYTRGLKKMFRKNPNTPFQRNDSHQIKRFDIKRLNELTIV